MLPILLDKSKMSIDIILFTVVHECCLGHYKGIKILKSLVTLARVKTILIDDEYLSTSFKNFCFPWAK